MPVELRIPEHLTIKVFDTLHGFASRVMRIGIREDANEWLKERLGRDPDLYLTGDAEGNWYYAISLPPEDELIAVEFRLTWS